MLIPAPAVKGFVQCFSRSTREATHDRYEYHPPFSLSAILPTLALRLKHRLLSFATKPFAGSPSSHQPSAALAMALRFGMSGTMCLYVSRWPRVLIAKVSRAVFASIAPSDFSG